MPFLCLLAKLVRPSDLRARDFFFRKNVISMWYTETSSVSLGISFDSVVQMKLLIELNILKTEIVGWNY